jgi:autotransporter-associated beta strand protein
MNKTIPTLLIIGTLILASHLSRAGSATWGTSPASGDWNTSSNWTPNTVPNGPLDLATFATSTRRAVSFSQVTEVNSIVFNPGASTFTITNAPFHEVTISGAGVINNSGVMQTIVSDSGSGSPSGKVDFPAFPSITFTNNATAGTNVLYISNGGQGELGVGGNINFEDLAGADHGIFIIHGSTGNAYVSEISFNNSSTGGNSTITLTDGGKLEMSAISPDLSTLADATVTNTGGLIFVNGQSTLGNASIVNTRTMSQVVDSLVVASNITLGSATAGNATITNKGANDTGNEGTTLIEFEGLAGQAVIINDGDDGIERPGGSITFGSLNGDTPDAQSATLIANPGTNGGDGGLILFSKSSLGDMARCELFGNGSLDISPHVAPGVTIGSLEGDGLVFLGAQNLTLGSNNLSTAFSGVIQDGGSNDGMGGSLTKIGAGRLTLTNANTYTGGTVINSGTLLVNNTTGSGLGTGAVQAIAGTLGGSGIISGTVAVGTGDGAGAVLAPGQNSVTPGTLTIKRSLTLRSDATYRVTLNSSTPAADRLIAKGVKIRGAQIVFNDGGSALLPPGTVFTIVRNTSENAISGTFSNLTDGEIIAVKGNNFQADYEGGDGNDLTLTVVP